jgi:hypothetical protein
MYPIQCNEGNKAKRNALEAIPSAEDKCARRRMSFGIYVFHIATKIRKHTKGVAWRSEKREYVLWRMESKY